MSKPNIFLEKVPRKTKAMVKILGSWELYKLEDKYEKFMEILFSNGSIVKGCQYSTVVAGSADVFYNLIVYYEVEKERVENIKKELKESKL